MSSWEIIVANFRAMSPWEVWGAITGLISVWLTVKQNVWCWPIGIANVLCWIVMFTQAKLYADVGLQAVYFVLSIYGWWAWLNPGAGKIELPVRRFPLWAWLPTLALQIAGTAALGGYLSTTDAAFPWVDSGTTVASLIAQWMLTKKILENWAIWIVADVVMIVMYAMKGLWLTSAIYVVFLVMCVQGHREWTRSPAPNSP